jgi:FtsZ-binding cell division protein ZapB
MLQRYGDTVLQAEALEKELAKARKHSAMLQSKLDGAFAQYHNEVQDMQAKSDELVRKNKSLQNKNKGMCHTRFSEENQVHTYMHARIKFHAYSDI